MRIIGTFFDATLARRFSFFLRKEGIDNTFEPSFEGEAKKISYDIWVHNEDDLRKASSYYDEFQCNPQDVKFDIAKEDERKSKVASLEFLRTPISPNKRKPADTITKGYFMPYRITFFLFIICLSVFFINIVQTYMLRKESAEKGLIPITSVQKNLMYDEPVLLIRFNEVIEKYHIDIYKQKDIPKDAQLALEKIEKLPVWKGVYDLIITKANKGSWTIPAMFVKIRQGQIWRAISPAFLHQGMLHILFNILWLWFLGRQIEERLNRGKYLLLVIIIAIVSNTAQYLMTGPYFEGFSGVVMGMLAFIWIRQKKAPWEGYPLQKVVIWFLLFFVLAMLFIQIIAFLFQMLGKEFFMPQIANTGHIVGGITGWFLGRFAFFSRGGVSEQ